MRYLLRHALILGFLLLATGVLNAQETWTPITPDKATDLQQLNTIGSALPANLAYSPDGRYILAATTDYTAVYRADDLSPAPKIYPFTDFDFNPAGELIANGHRWNLDTGLKTGIAAGTRILPPSEESPTTRIEITKPGGNVIVVDMGDISRVESVVVNQNYTRAAVVEKDDQNDSTVIRLYELPDGHLYAVLPQSHPIVVDIFFSAETTTTVEQLMINTYQPYFESFDGDKHPYQVNLYWSETGLLRNEYSGASYSGLHFNANKTVVAYDLNDKQIVIIKAGGVFSPISIEKLGKNNYQSLILVVWEEKILIKQPDMDQNDVYTIDSDHRPVLLTSLIEPNSYQTALTVQEQWVVIKQYNEILIWDTSNPNITPYTVVAEMASEPDISISPNNTYIAYNIHTDKGNRRIVYDFVDGFILTDVPISTVMSPDWSSLSYWEHGKLIVRDLTTFTDTILEVLPTYVGAVVDIDFATGKAAFSGETFSVIRISNGRELALPPLDTVPYGAEFVRDGKAIVVFSEQVEEREEYTYWNEYIFEEGLIEGLTYRDYGASRNFKMSPQGRYIISYYSYCDSPYVAPETHIAPFADVNIPLPEGVPSSGTIVSGCGANSAAFVLDESLFYGVNGNRLTRFEPKESEDDLFWWGTDLMYYDYQADRSHSFTYSLSLSPDEQSVVLFVEHYQTVDSFDGYTTLQLEGYSIELFELNSLPASQQRDDAIPKLIIPNATTALFSPDSQMIVTNVGLYGFEDGLLSAEADGTISAFNPDSTLLATYQDDAVTLWDVHDAESARYPLAQYQMNGVTELGFSSDTSRLYVVRAGEVQVWGIEAP